MRKISIGFNNVVDEIYTTYNFLNDYKAEQRENNLQKAVISIKNKYGKNALLKGTSYQSRATARERNKLIGGHNGYDE